MREPALIRRLRHAWRASARPPETRRADSPEQALSLVHWSDSRPLRLELPADWLRMLGGIAYGPGHPFVMALARGPEELDRFYALHAPDGLARMYAPQLSGEAGAQLPPWLLPWRLRAVERPPPGERGLPADQGVAMYGPCSPAKVALEMHRLRDTAAAIRRAGFDPDRHGDIEGQMLTDGERVAFLIAGGKHRAAALVHLGHSHVPVRLRPTLPGLIDSRQARHWPLVADGRVSLRLALAAHEVTLAGRAVGAEQSGQRTEIRA